MKQILATFAIFFIFICVLLAGYFTGEKYMPHEEQLVPTVTAQLKTCMKGKYDVIVSDFICKPDISHKSVKLYLRGK